MSNKYIYLISFVFFSFVFWAIFALTGESEKFQLKKIEVAEKKCSDDGGRLMGPSRPTEEINADDFRCFQVFSDAGKNCTSSEECQGDCVTNRIRDLGKKGFCQEIQYNTGCYTPVEKDRLECSSGRIRFTCNSTIKNDFCDSLRGNIFFD